MWLHTSPKGDNLCMFYTHFRSLEPLKLSI